MPRTPQPFPNFQFLDPDSGRSVSKRDWLLMDAGYELIVDNLLDLSHVSYLHDGILGSVETVKADIKLEQKGYDRHGSALVSGLPGSWFLRSDVQA